MHISGWQFFVVCGVFLSFVCVIQTGAERFFKSNHPIQALLVLFVLGGAVGMGIQHIALKLSPSLAQKQLNVLTIAKWSCTAMSVFLLIPLWMSLATLGRTKRLYGRMARQDRARFLGYAMRSRNVLPIVFLIGVMAVVFGVLMPLKGVVCPRICLVPGLLLLMTMVVHFSTPPAVLLLGSSNWKSVRLFSFVDRGICPYRAVVLFDPVLSETCRLSAVERLNFAPDNLRILGARDWQKVVHKIADLVPLIVVDTRTPSPAVVEETKKMVLSPFRCKTVFVVDEDGDSPAAQKGGCLDALSTCETTIMQNVVNLLKSRGLSETSSPDDNPAITQAMYNYHSSRLSRLMTKVGAAGVPLSSAVRDAMKRRGRTPLIDRAMGLFERLNGNPGDGALEVYAQLESDISAVQEFLETEELPGNWEERKIVCAMNNVYRALCDLQRAVDAAPVSFHTRNQ